jgi:BMFP domain-containing protein YqiC
MLDQLIATVSQKTGMAPDKAKQAVESVVTQLKAKLPAPVSAHIDELMAGNYTGTLADVEAKFKSHFGGSTSMADVSAKAKESMADASAKAKDALSGVQDKLNSMLHKSP